MAMAGIKSSNYHQMEMMMLTKMDEGNI